MITQEENIESLHYILITIIFSLALFTYAQHLYIIIDFINLIDERNKIQTVIKDTEDTCTQTSEITEHIYNEPIDKRLVFKTFLIRQNHNCPQTIS